MHCIVNEVLKNKKTWKREYDKINNYFKENIGKSDTFNKCVVVRFYPETKPFKMRISDYLVNLIFWQPYIKFKRHLKKDIIFDCENITQNSIKEYFDTNIIIPFKRKYKNKILNRECAKVLEVLADVGTDYGLIMGCGLNLYSMISLRERNKRFGELLETDIPPMLQPSEIESYLNGLNRELVDMLKTEDNCFKPFLNSGQGVKTDQLNEFMVSEGLKPDLEGNTFPIPINTNLLMRGLDTPTHYLLDASGGRKALIMNKEFTGKSGYFARRLDLLCLNIKLHDDPDYDCKTKRLIEFTIDNFEVLKRLNGIHYKKKPNDIIYRIIDYRNDLHLIGKTVHLRTAATCNSKKGICHKCYGELSYINNDISIGLFAVKELTSKFTQNILSSKHLLKTHSTEIKLPKVFDEILTLDGGYIMINPDLENLSKYTITIDPNEIENDNELDDESSSKYIKQFKIKNKKTNKSHTISAESEDEDDKRKKIFMTDYIEKLMVYDNDTEMYNVKLDKIETDEILFWVVVENNELIKPLNDTKKLIDSKDHFDCNTIDEMAQKFCKLLIDSHISTHMTHAFVIMRNIMRNPDKLLELPDYSLSDPEYEMLSVQKALKYHPSPLVSLSFERIKEQFKNPITFQKKGSSMLDGLFKIDYK